MGVTTKNTRDMLAKHHRDGAWFANLMIETYPNRFNDEFWRVWQELMMPAFSDSPVVLDLGSGPAMFIKDLIKRYPGTQAIGVECAPYMLDVMGKLPDGASVMDADLQDPTLDLADSSIDGAIASVVLHEMNQPIRTFKEIHRCLKPAGRFYILDWVRSPLSQYIAAESDEAKVFGDEIGIDELDDLFVHFVEHNRFSRADLAYMLEHTGYRVVDSTPLREGRFARLVAEKI